MIFAQILLITAVLAIMALGLRSYSSRTRALTTIAFLGFAALAISAILFPVWTGRVANLIGIGRGTDLVMYCLVIFVMFSTVNGSIQHRREQRRFTQLVRHIVLMEAGTPIPPTNQSADLEPPVSDPTQAHPCNNDADSETTITVTEAS